MQPRAAANRIFLCYGAGLQRIYSVMTSSAEETNPTGTSEQQPQAEVCCPGALGELCATAEKYTREEPLKSTAGAFAVGLILAMLPLGQIFGGLVRLLFALLRPALLLLGVMKTFEEIEKRRSSTEHRS